MQGKKEWMTSGPNLGRVDSLCFLLYLVISVDVRRREKEILLIPFFLQRCDGSTTFEADWFSVGHLPPPLPWYQSAHV